MILVDSSVWIAHLRGHETDATAKLRSATQAAQVLVGDLILLEILQGARDDEHAFRIERALRQFPLVPLLSGDLAPLAAAHDRTLRRLGLTIRKTADLIIGTYCIERRHALLHDDRDFDAMHQHLGLAVA